MLIKRILPPAAAPIQRANLLNAIFNWADVRSITAFSEDLRRTFQKKHCFLVSSGKTALFLILEALKTICPLRNQVLIPAFTCFSVPSAIVRAGLQVKLCDIDLETLDFDFSAMKMIFAANAKQSSFKDPRAVDPSRLLAILPTHLFGLPADVERIRYVANDPAIVIVEDAAQAFYAPYKDTYLGCQADIGFFSLGRGKAFTTVEGGIIITDRDDLAHSIGQILLKLNRPELLHQAVLAIYAGALDLLLHPNRFWLPKALPFLHLGETIFDPDFPMRSFSPFQARLATHWQEQMYRFQLQRQISVLEWRTRLRKINVGQFPFDRTAAKCITRYPIKVFKAADRKKLIHRSDKAGLGITPSYPTSIDQIEELSTTLEKGAFPKAAQIAREIVTLPVHEFVTPADRDRITGLLSDCCRN